MTTGLIVALLFVTLVLLVVTTSVLEENASRKRQLLRSVDAKPGRSSKLIGGLDSRFRRTGWGARLAALLAGAGLVNFSPLLFVAMASASAVLVALATLPLLGKVGAAVAGIAVLMSYRKWLERRREARTERFVAQLPELARLLANGAQAGLGMTKSLELAAREMEDPASAELSQVSSELALGRTLEVGLNGLAARLPSRELVVLVRTLVIQGKTGGALVTALSNIATTLDERRQLRREVKTAVVGAAFSGYAVVLIGVGSLFLMNLVSPGSLDEMLGSLFGRIALIVAASLFGIGFVTIRRLTKVTL